MNLAVAGATGRMGRAVLRLAGDIPGVRLVALEDKPDAVIEFTAPAYAVELAEQAARRGAILVTGTTGLSAAQQRAVEAAARRAVIVQSGNFSVGINVLSMLVEQAARLLDARYEISIADIHHRHKKDAPSGTALMLGRAAAKGRPGITIPFESLREGEVIGEHTVRLSSDSEALELTHKALTRDIFAQGALQAALWAQGKKPGLYGMQEVLA